MKIIKLTLWQKMMMGVLFLLGHSIVLYHVFLTSFFKGDYKTTVDFNYYGEGIIEFFAFPLSIIVGIWAIYKIAKMPLE